MKKIIAPLALLLVALAAFTLSPLVAANNSSTAANAGATQISSTIYCHLDTNIWAWVGHAIVTIGNGPPKFAKIVDQSTGAGAPPGQVAKDGMWYGTEVMVLTFVDGSGSIELTCKYHATPASAPGLYTLHEVCTIGNGTGAYAGISGTASIEGSFVGSTAALEYNLNEDESAPLLCIGSMHGQVSGINVQ